VFETAEPEDVATAMRPVDAPSGTPAVSRESDSIVKGAVVEPNLTEVADPRPVPSMVTRAWIAARIGENPLMTGPSAFAAWTTEHQIAATPKSDTANRRRPNRCVP